MLELASGEWNLVIVNVAMTDVRGPLFYMLKDLAQGAADAPEGAELDATRPKGIRVLFLVPMLAASDAQPVLERKAFRTLLKPYHLHDFLEKVGELLVEAGALADPIRSMSDFSGAKKRGGVRAPPARPAAAMFASRDDYQMSEEELLEWERTEEEDRKKREKELKNREHLTAERQRIRTGTAPRSKIPPTIGNPARNHSVARSHHEGSRASLIRASTRRRTPCIPATKTSGFPAIIILPLVAVMSGFSPSPRVDAPAPVSGPDSSGAGASANPSPTKR